MVPGPHTVRGRRKRRRTAERPSSWRFDGPSFIGATPGGRAGTVATPKESAYTTLERMAFKRILEQAW